MKAGGVNMPGGSRIGPLTGTSPPMQHASKSCVHAPEGTDVHACPLAAQHVKQEPVPMPANWLLCHMHRHAAPDTLPARAACTVSLGAR
jgi:hypothetical protein